MAIDIEDANLEDLARELAVLRGLTPEQAIHLAVSNALAEIRTRPVEDKDDRP